MLGITSSTRRRSQVLVILTLPAANETTPSLKVYLTFKWPINSNCTIFREIKAERCSCPIHSNRLVIHFPPTKTRQLSNQINLTLQRRAMCLRPPHIQEFTSTRKLAAFRLKYIANLKCGQEYATVQSCSCPITNRKTLATRRLT